MSSPTKSLQQTFLNIYKYTHVWINQDSPWNLAICDNIDGPRGYNTKWNKSDTEGQILCDFTYRWNLKNETNEQTKSETDS